MTPQLHIGLIGLDTPHAVTFTTLLHDAASPHHVAGGRVVAAYPGGSRDFHLSWSRVGSFTKELRDNHEVEILDSPEAVAERCDAILLTAVDGRAHRELFERISRYGRPTFIDKPFATRAADAEAIAARARDAGIPLMAASSLRFSDSLRTVLVDYAASEIIGADFFGPMELEPTQPGLFWYGVHSVEMLYAVLGRGCQQVTAFTNNDHDLIVGVWADGRIGTIRGNRKGNSIFGGVVHRQRGSQPVDANRDDSLAKYARLLKQVLQMFASGKATLDLEETVETIRFMEAANESRYSGQPMSLPLHAIDA